MVGAVLGMSIVESDKDDAPGALERREAECRVAGGCSEDEGSGIVADPPAYSAS